VLLLPGLEVGEPEESIELGVREWLATVTLDVSTTGETMTREEHFCRSALSAFMIRSLSPILDIPISFNVVWSSSRRISPRISFTLNV
jgi:hypothetical protein